MLIRRASSALCRPAKENRALAGPVSSPAWGRRRHLPEGNNCRHYGRHNLGGWRRPVALQHPEIMRFAVATDNAKVGMSAMQYGQHATFTPDFLRQKFQRCALATRKSRNACTRATALSSSG